MELLYSMMSGDGEYMLQSVELIAFITGLTSHEEPGHTNNAALWLTNALEKLISVKMSDNINNRLLQQFNLISETF